MSRCARCTEIPEATVDRAAAGVALCPEHALAALEDVRRDLATTLMSLARASDRASDMVGSGAEG